MRSHPRRLPRRIIAVLFDMDGVLVDSMPYHFLAWHEALKTVGVSLAPLDIYAREGELWQKSMRFFLEKGGIVPTEARLNEVFGRCQSFFRRCFRATLFPGALELLEGLAASGTALALVTGTSRRDCRKILPARALRYFDVIVTGDDVARGKPDPEPYRQAWRRLGVRKAECVVVENAPFGIRSARRAGIFTIAVASGLPPSYLCRADRVVGSLRTLLPLFSRRVRGRDFRCR